MKMTLCNHMKICAAFLALALLAAAGCGGSAPAPPAAANGNQEHREGASMLAWSARYEFFVQAGQPGPDGASEWTVHVTRLEDYKPLAAGRVQLDWTDAAGRNRRSGADAPARPGIFVLRAGPFNGQGAGGRLTVTTPGGSESADVKPAAHEHAGEAEHEAEGNHGAEEGEHAGETAGAHASEEAGNHPGEGGKLIAFAKERQWEADFRVDPVAEAVFSDSVLLTGELRTRPQAEAVVSAPVGGIVSPRGRLPFPGERVGKGQVVAVLEPPVNRLQGRDSVEASLAEARVRLAQARRETERARSLVEAGVAPRRRLEDAEFAQESARVGCELLEKAVTGLGQPEEGGRVTLRAPMGGVAAEVGVRSGAAVEAGTQVIRIVDASTLWLSVAIPAAQAHLAAKPDAGQTFFTVEGEARELRPSRLVSVSDVLDSTTRTLPVIFEVANPDHRLKAGQYARVTLRTGQPRRALGLPEGALLEEEGHFFAFVQAGGEDFVRREVQTGAREGGLVEVVSGLSAGDRVATRGTYYLKLAETPSGAADPHAGHNH